MASEYFLEGEKLVVRTSIPLLSLLEMEIIHKMNAHGRLVLKAVVSEENMGEILNGEWLDTRVIILKKNDRAPLYHGRISGLICKKENSLLTVEITGVGDSILLDLEKRKRSFQNKSLTYSQVIKKVLKNTKGAEFIWGAGIDREIEEPLIQYEETDWEFLVRLCSHFNRTLIGEVETGKVSIYFGMCQGTERNINSIEILGQGFDGMAYYLDGCYENKKSRNNVFYLKVRTRENWKMGDFIFYEGARYRVYKREISFMKGELFFLLFLGTDGIYYQKKYYNQSIKGARLEGTVRKVEEESVYLQLDIDQEEQADYAWEWSPETNNLCYCMPETGTKSSLYLPSVREAEGRVILSTIKNPQNSIYKNVQNREFITAKNKKLGMQPDRLFLEGANGAVSMELDDSSGIRVKSSTAISLIAKADIEVEGQGKVCINAPQNIVCRTHQANIEICRDFNFYAPEGVKNEGSAGKMEKKQTETSDGEKVFQEDCWQASYSAMAAIPSVDFKDTEGTDTAMNLSGGGCIPKVAKGSTTIALSEAMQGKKESETSFPKAFQSMECYTVKGGYALPEEAMSFS